MIRVSSAGGHSDSKCECTSNNIVLKYKKKNLAELKVHTDQQSYLHKLN